MQKYISWLYSCKSICHVEEASKDEMETFRVIPKTASDGL